MRLAQQHVVASSFPSREQQLLQQSIVAVAGELAVLAPEPAIVKAVDRLATAAVHVYMAVTDAAVEVSGASQSGIAHAALAQLFTPMAQLVSPALLHVADCSSSSSSSSTDASTAGDDRKKIGVFNMVLGICAKCAFDSSTGECRFRAGNNCKVCISMHYLFLVLCVHHLRSLTSKILNGLRGTPLLYERTRHALNSRQLRG
jgi:hypothetical protein